MLTPYWDRELHFYLVPTIIIENIHLTTIRLNARRLFYLADDPSMIATNETGSIKFAVLPNRVRTFRRTCIFLTLMSFLDAVD